MVTRCNTNDSNDPNKLVILDEVDKIHLTPLRSKFIVIGTKDAIFDWMEHNDKVVCELDQEFFLLPLPKPPLRTATSSYKISSVETPDPMIMFELYDDEEHQHDNHNHHHENILKVLPKKLFSSSGMKRYHGSSKMRLEISVRKFDKHSQSSEEDEGVNQTPIMKVKGKSGKRLRHVLNVWDHGRSRTLNNRNKLSSEQLSRMTSDFE